MTLFRPRISVERDRRGGGGPHTIVRIGDRRGNGRLIGLGVAVMLAVAAFASTQPAFAPDESGSVNISEQNWLGDAATYVAVGLVVIGVLGLLLGLIFSGTNKVEAKPQRRSTLGQIAFIAAVILAGRFGLFDGLRDMAAVVAPQGGVGATDPAGDELADEVVVDPIRGIDLFSGLGFVAVCLALLALLVWRKRQATTEPAVNQSADEALREDLGRAVDRLDDESLDHRRSVLACYEEMEATMAGHGLPRSSHETPEDFLLRIHSRLGTERPAAETLTRLVNHALYDKAEMTGTDRQQARTALGSLVSERGAHVD